MCVGGRDGWSFWGSNPGGGKKLFSLLLTGRGAHPASCKMGTWVLSLVCSDRYMRLTIHPQLAARFPLCVLMTCYWETFIFTFMRVAYVSHLFLLY